MPEENFCRWPSESPFSKWQRKRKMTKLRRTLKLPAQERHTLHDIVRANDVSAMAKVLDGGADINERDGRMWTALHMAAIRGTTAIAVILMDKGAELDAREEDAWTPLHLCCQDKKSMEIATMLADRGANLQAKTADGSTPLHVCSQHGTTEIATMLADRGVDLKAEGAENWTPLHMCSQFGRTEIATMLIERRSNVNAVTNSNFTPLLIAAVHGQVHILEVLLAPVLGGFWRRTDQTRILPKIKCQKPCFDCHSMRIEGFWCSNPPVCSSLDASFTTTEAIVLCTRQGCFQSQKSPNPF